MIASLLTAIGIVLFVIIICVAAIIAIVALGLLALFIALAVLFIVAILETVIWLVFVNIAYGVIWVIDIPFSIVRKFLRWLTKEIKKKGEKTDKKPKDEDKGKKEKTYY
jgi:membrane-bound ClpP family serine protease